MRVPSAKTFAVAIAALFLTAQAIQIRRVNPPVTAEAQLPAPVRDVVRRSCYSCHSNETEWPWYAYVAPASWLVGHDVNDGRRHLNFSEWGAYKPDVRQ